MKCLSVRFLFCCLFNWRTSTFLSTDHIQLYITHSADAEGAWPLLFHTTHIITWDVASGGRKRGHTPELWCFVEFRPQGSCWTSTAKCPPATAHPASPQQDTARAWMRLQVANGAEPERSPADHSQEWAAGRSSFLWVCPSLLSLSQGQKTWLWERHHLVFVLGTPACHGWATGTGLVLASATWSWAEVGNSFCVWISCSFVPFCYQYCSVPLRFLSHCCLFSVNCYSPHSLCLCPSLTESGGKREVEQLIWNLIPTTGTRNLENGLVLQLTAGKRTSSVQHF